ncbi:FAD synthetase [Loigolactobacillus jiayinensis]|uniref:Riboflavin biosynthesis protein n=1 Tax=Loigolactobacillus jiayinensis TaxID=2486016 RepID=A0ABW1REM3_9LACO|nr:FAD synthetase [Loigolactobacillus jiayinensis]
METVHIHHPYTPQQLTTNPCVLTLGFFDGVHRGHQAVIQRGREVAQQQHLPLAVMTFNQHPRLVFRQLNYPENTYLSTLAQKEKILAQLGVDILYVIDFTSAFASLTPANFVEQYLVGLQAQTVVAGFDYTFGNQPAPVTELANYAQQRFTVTIVSRETAAALKISSSRIRTLFDRGDLQQANQLLGYVYTTQAVVLHGATYIALQVTPTSRLPAAGQYVVKLHFNQHWYDAQVTVPSTHTDQQIQLTSSELTQPIFGEIVTLAWLNKLEQPQQLPVSRLGAYPTK